MVVSVGFFSKGLPLGLVFGLTIVFVTRGIKSQTKGAKTTLKPKAKPNGGPFVMKTMVKPKAIPKEGPFVTKTTAKPNGGPFVITKRKKGPFVTKRRPKQRKDPL